MDEAARSLKTPPALTKDSVYSDWVQDVEMWESFTDVAQAKRGPAVYLSLKGKARECSRTREGGNCRRWREENNRKVG